MEVQKETTNYDTFSTYRMGIGLENVNTSFTINSVYCLTITNDDELRMKPKFFTFRYIFN